MENNLADQLIAAQSTPTGPPPNPYEGLVERAIAIGIHRLEDGLYIHSKQLRPKDLTRVLQHPAPLPQDIKEYLYDRILEVAPRIDNSLIQVAPNLYFDGYSLRRIK